MINTSKDKMQREAKVKGPEFMYFPFASDGDLPTITIRAGSLREAQAKWNLIKSNKKAGIQSGV